MPTSRQKRRKAVSVALESWINWVSPDPDPDDCPVLPPDYSATRSVSPLEFLPRVGTSEERERLDPGALWGLRIMEGSVGTANLLYDPGAYPRKMVTIKDSTHTSEVSGEC